MVFYSIKSSILAKLVKMGLFDLVTPHGFTIKIARLLKHSNLAIFVDLQSLANDKKDSCPWPERLSEFRPQVHLLKQ